SHTCPLSPIGRNFQRMPNLPVLGCTSVTSRRSKRALAYVASATDTSWAKPASATFLRAAISAKVTWHRQRSCESSASRCSASALMRSALSWVIEPEMAFSDLEDDMNLAEEFIKYIIKYALENNREDLDFLATRLVEEEKQKPQNERGEMGLIEKLEFVINNDFERLTYTEAIEILKESTPNKKKKFQYLVNEWGIDLQSEHERYLVEKHFKKPVILINYPKEIKAFYMRQNDDGKTVAAMDILAPGIGEIVGGSQREERLDVLEKRMQEMNIPVDEMNWYLDTRRFGTAAHAGFGLGFERIIQFVTGMTNIRDVIPFPRFPKNAEF
ncbi:MAG: amino acid--tRNA ligase-related protein, partial [Ginsengibacter sp.]